MRELPKTAKRRIDAQLLKLEEGPYGRGVTKLTGSDSFRMRVGDYRIVYEIVRMKRLVTVSRISHRKDAYR